MQVCGPEPRIVVILDTFDDKSGFAVLEVTGVLLYLCVP